MEKVFWNTFTFLKEKNTYIEMYLYRNIFIQKCKMYMFIQTFWSLLLLTTGEQQVTIANIHESGKRFRKGIFITEQYIQFNGC